MGISYACVWATIYSAVHEMGSLIPKYDSHMPLFLPFIDDIVGILTGKPGGRIWEELKEETNNFGILTWEFMEPAKSVDFLDLIILIENKQIVTRTYQKALNLYQYIIPISNHPPKMIEGIIFSLLRTTKTEFF